MADERIAEIRERVKKAIAAAVREPYGDGRVFGDGSAGVTSGGAVRSAIVADFYDPLQLRFYLQAREDIPYLLDALAASEGREQKWQAITTAPMDGRRILLYGVAGFGETSSGAGYWDRDPVEEGGQCWRDDMGQLIEPPPTHWMPLPDPPTQ
jgi:hypothetical protein